MVITLILAHNTTTNNNGTTLLSIGDNLRRAGLRLTAVLAFLTTVPKYSYIIGPAYTILYYTILYYTIRQCTILYYDNRMI